MKKYLQVTIVLGAFGLLVLFRQLKGSQETPVVVRQVTPTTGASSTTYKDGIYTGPTTDAFYGNVQVQVTIRGGKITDVQFLDSPHDAGTSREINSQAMPLLRQEAITAQSAQVDVVSGASQTSAAFQQSLSGALQQAS